MTTHHKDLCPCGSGKRYKHCHLESDRKRNRRDLGLAIGVVAALVVGVAAWGAITQWRANQAASGNVPRDTTGGLAGSPAAPISGGPGDVSGTSAPVPQGAFGGIVPGRNNEAPIPTTAGKVVPMGGTQAVQPGENPVPWQYDVAKNRHYDPRPGHQHWHTGPPPSDTAKAASPLITSTPIVTAGGSATSLKTTTTTNPISGGTQALAPGENPAPWEYDVAKNRHFDPRDAHRHWHSGPPPPVSERGK